MTAELRARNRTRETWTKPSTRLGQEPAYRSDTSRYFTTQSMRLTTSNLGRGEWESANSLAAAFDTTAVSSGPAMAVAETYVTAFDPAAFVAFRQISILVAATGPESPERLRYLAGLYPFQVPSAAATAPTFAPGTGQHSFNDRLRLVLTTGISERLGTVRRLHYLGSPVLRQRAAPVAEVDGEVRRLVDDLLETMRDNHGVGLAANQIGTPLRVAVVDVGEDDPPPLVLINPRIVQASDATETAEEGCLSIPDMYGDVERPLMVTLEAIDRDGRPYRVQVSGFKARAVQHEIDHLDGVLFLDHLSAVKRGLLLAKWKKSRKGKPGYLQELSRDLES